MTHRDLILAENPDLKRLDTFLTTRKEKFDFQMNYPAVIFIQIFREQIRSTILLTEESTSRSNWTYNIAFAFLTAAKAMNFQIRFEAEGKRDAIIESEADKKGKRHTILAAEWEWESSDIFGKGKEIEKLYKSSKAYECEAFLYTYVETDKYNEFLIRVRDEWRALSEKTPLLSLVMCTVLYTKEKSSRMFQAIRTVEIATDELIIWEDLPLS